MNNCERKWKHLEGCWGRQKENQLIIGSLNRAQSQGLCVIVECTGTNFLGKKKVGDYSRLSIELGKLEQFKTSSNLFFELFIAQDSSTNLRSTTTNKKSSSFLKWKFHCTHRFSFLYASEKTYTFSPIIVATSGFFSFTTTAFLKQSFGNLAAT